MPRGTTDLPRNVAAAGGGVGRGPDRRALARQVADGRSPSLCARSRTSARGGELTLDALYSHAHRWRSPEPFTRLRGRRPPHYARTSTGLRTVGAGSELIPVTHDIAPSRPRRSCGSWRFGRGSGGSGRRGSLAAELIRSHAARGDLEPGREGAQGSQDLVTAATLLEDRRLSGTERTKPPANCPRGELLRSVFTMRRHEQPSSERVDPCTLHLPR